MSVDNGIDCNAFFASIPIMQFPPLSGGVITVESTCRIVDAAHVLTKHNILCAPVRNVDAADDAPWNEKYVGIIDMVSHSHNGPCLFLVKHL
jgi:hypothetical protein